MKLKCTGKYVNDARGLRFRKGQVFEVDEAQATFLMADAPGCFEEVKAAKRSRGKAVGKAPANKAVVEPEEDK